MLRETDREIQGEVERILVPLERWDVFSHLQALCNNDATFCIWKAKTDEDLESLVVGDTQAIRRAGDEAQGAIIGTVRLLPAGSDTVTMFVAKDAVFHEEIGDEGKALFRKFIQRVKNHFNDLRLPVPARNGKGGIVSQKKPAAQHIQTEPLKPTDEHKPWELIPDHLWDRLAVKMWCANYSAREIANQIPDVHHRRVTNRLSELRQLYPHASIPTHKQRRERMIREVV